MPGVLSRINRSGLQVPKPPPLPWYCDGGAVVACFPLGEAAGTVARSRYGGTYAGTIKSAAPGYVGPASAWNGHYFDGINDWVDLVTGSTLPANFPYTAGSLSIWTKVGSADILTDGKDRYAFRFRYDDNNIIGLRRQVSVNNGYRLDFKAGGTSMSWSMTGITSTDWQHWLITWSASNTRVIIYLAGLLNKQITWGSGSFAGNFTSMYLGSSLSGISSINAWEGGLAWATIFNRELTSDEAARLAAT